MSAFPDGAEGVEEEPLGPTVEATETGPAPAEPATVPATEVPTGPTAVAGLGGAESELERVTAERDEYLEALRRLQAEFDNYRKRTTRQQTELLDRAAEGLLERLLPVLDAVDLALQHKAGAPEGGDDGAAFAQIAALLRDALARDGLERIDAVGVSFDPSIHDAVAHLPAAEPPAPAPSTPGEAPSPGEATPAGTPGPPGPSTGALSPDAPVGPGPGPGSGAPGAASGGEGAPSTIVAEVLRAGYRLKGRVLRPAMVTVQG